MVKRLGSKYGCTASLLGSTWPVPAPLCASLPTSVKETVIVLNTHIRMPGIVGPACCVTSGKVALLVLNCQAVITFSMFYLMFSTEVSVP